MTNIPAFSLKCKRREILIRIATNVTLSKMSSFFLLLFLLAGTGVGMGGRVADGMEGWGIVLVKFGTDLCFAVKGRSKLSLETRLCSPRFRVLCTPAHWRKRLTDGVEHVIMVSLPPPLPTPQAHRYRLELN